MREGWGDGGGRREGCISYKKGMSCIIDDVCEGTVHVRVNWKSDNKENICIENSNENVY